MIAAFRAGVVTLLILLLGSAATLSALATKPSSAVATYPYDGHHASAQVCNDAVERGPPERKSTDTTHAAGDDPSSGTPVLLARAPTTHADFTYDHLPPVVQVASVAPSTERPQSTRLVPISPCARWRVAAKTTPELASGMERTGSALTKSDPFHRSVSWVVDNPAAQRFAIRGGDGVARNLYQLPGEVNGKSGVFEWIIDRSGSSPVINHQRFIPGGSITGFPNQAVR